MASHTLIFAITSLDLFMYPLLHLSLEDSCSSRLVEAGYLQDMRCVNPVVRPPSHDMVSSELELIHRYLSDISIVNSSI